MTREVDAYGALLRLRHPLGVVALNVVTLGVYGAVWYYRVNAELREFGRAYRDRELSESSPRQSLLAFVPGAVLLLPPIVSLVGFVGRVRRAQRYGRSELASGWLVAVLFLSLVFIPAIPGYAQSSLNELWRRYAEAAPDVTAARRPRLSRAWTWLVGPEREAHPPPEWVFRPIVGLAAVATSVAIFLTPAAILGFVTWIILAVEVYEDRRALGLPYFWWSSAVGTFGPLVFLMYVQNRRETLANMRPEPGAGESAPPAWYPDPLGRARLRWWDGRAWTGAESG